MLKNILKFILIFLFLVSLNIYSKTIGETKLDLKGGNPKLEETVLGNFLTDAIKYSAKVEYSILPAGAVGEGIEKGEIKEEEIFYFTPYLDDEIVIIELDGKKIKEMLEISIRLYPKENNNFLQVSGISFLFDRNKKIGERIVEIKMKDENLDENKKYQIATNSFLAAGGVGYYKIFNENNIVKRTKVNLKEAIIKYILEKKTIKYEIEGRIKEKEGTEEKSK
jgi:2',3'-cyclic-nucleotide 2'-phosphodiesterase (5'-nucleotidase family)